MEKSNKNSLSSSYIKVINYSGLMPLILKETSWFHCFAHQLQSVVVKII